MRNRMAAGPRPGKVHAADESATRTACGRSLTGPVTRLPEVTSVISAVTCERCRRAIAAAEREAEEGSGDA